jgi:hypothetical protein
MGPMKKIAVDVREYSGYRAAESPRSFRWGEREYEITEIFSRTRELQPDGHIVNRFAIRAADQSFILLYDESGDRWYLLIE